MIRRHRQRTESATAPGHPARPVRVESPEARHGDVTVAAPRNGEATAPHNAGCCETVVPLRVAPAEIGRWSGVFRALSDPTRLRILALLSAQQRPLCVRDIVAQFPLEQPTISHHLKVLRDAGLVTAERRGLWVYYKSSPSGLMESWRAIGRLLP